MTKYKTLSQAQSISRFTPLALRGGLNLRNRVAVPPMASETAAADGKVTEKTLRHYESLSSSGAGLVMVEYTFVEYSGRSEPNQLGIDTDAHVPGLASLANAIHAAGAVAGIQLTHAGGKSSRDLTGGVLQGPSNVPVPVKGQEMEVPDPLSPGAISALCQAFVAASDRAHAAGFDLVELHAAHGYGLNQWLSGHTNLRRDAYGGSDARRSRLLLEIVRAIRLRHPQLLIAVRMPGQDFIERGLDAREAVQLARRLERAGVDLLDVSSGIGGWRRPEGRNGEGYLVPEARRIQSAVKVPVIGVGGIRTGEFIDQALQERSVSIAAVGRAILEDPLGWKERVLALA